MITALWPCSLIAVRVSSTVGPIHGPPDCPWLWKAKNHCDSSISACSATRRAMVLASTGYGSGVAGSATGQNIFSRFAGVGTEDAGAGVWIVRQGTLCAVKSIGTLAPVSAESHLRSG